MDNDFEREHGLMTEKELLEIDQRLKRIEEEGLKNSLKHFDRIHDKLFTFNNILIAGYFALSKLENKISISTILIPIANLIILLFIEYSMMGKSRFESEITKRPVTQISTWGKSIERTNLYSLISIISTSIVTIIVLKYLLF